MVIELQVITDIFSKEDSVGKRKLLHKNKVINKLFDINEIEVQEFIDAKSGKCIKKYSGIYNKDVYYKINKPYAELKDMKINKTYPVKGFMGHSIKYK